LAAAVRLDLVVERSVVVGIKAVEELSAVHRSQLLTYLKVSVQSASSSTSVSVSSEAE
jgi:GxxExxY protein